MTENSNLSDLKKAIFILASEKTKLFLFAFLFLVTATFEMLSLASIGVVISKLVSFTSEPASFIGIPDIYLGIMVVSVFALRGIMLVFLSYKLWEYTVNFGAELRTRLMTNYQNMSYERFTEIDPGQYSQIIL